MDRTTSKKGIPEYEEETTTLIASKLWTGTIVVSIFIIIKFPLKCSFWFEFSNPQT